MANSLNLELRDDIDPSGNDELSVQVVRRDPETNEVIPLGVFLISNGLNPHRIRTYRRPGDAGSSTWSVQDVHGQMIDLKAVEG